MKLLCLNLGLALGCTLLLFLVGDFTAKVGEPDRDIWVTQPSPGWRLMNATSVAVPFAALSSLVFAITGKLLVEFRLTRLFLITTLGLTAVMYYYGNFKTVLGSGMVFYDLPRGSVRLAISAGCGSVTAAVATAASVVCRTVWCEWTEANVKGSEGVSGTF